MGTWWDRIDWDRVILYSLLSVVAVAAAVISFDALRSLAELAGFSPRLSWLVAVVVDAGAAAGTRVWLTRTGSARRFARWLALVNISVSILGNGFAHWLAAYDLAPPWWLVPAVSAIAPVTLAAVVHLAVLVSKARAVAEQDRARASREEVERQEAARVAAEVARVAAELAATGGAQGGEGGIPGGNGGAVGGNSVPEPMPETFDEKAARLIAEGYGRKRLASALEVEQHVSRRLINASRRNGSSPEEESAP